MFLLAGILGCRTEIFPDQCKQKAISYKAITEPKKNKVLEKSRKQGKLGSVLLQSPEDPLPLRSHL